MLRTTRQWLLALGMCVVLGASALAADTPPSSDHGAGAHAGKKTSVFEGGLGNAVLTLIIFGIVVYILGQKAWPPLLRVLKEREDLIRESLEAARREREQAEKLLVEYQRQLDRSREEATMIVEEGRRDAEHVRERIHTEARREADEMVARAKREIQLATDAAVKELYDQTAELAVRVAGGIIQKSLSADEHRDLVRQSLDAMRSSRGAAMN